MHPRNWPVWTWALLTVAVYPLGYELTVGTYTFSTGVALLAGCMLGSSGVLRSQGLALIALMVLSLIGLFGEVADWGYMVGRIFAGVIASRWAATPAIGTSLTRPPQRSIHIVLLLMGVVAIATTQVWQEPWIGQQLKPYFNAVLILAMVIAFFYALKLVARPARVLALTASLSPYYVIGLTWAALTQRILRPTDEIMAASDLLFHGYVTHLPGDVLTAVVVAFLTGPKRGQDISLSR